MSSISYACMHFLPQHIVGALCSVINHSQQLIEHNPMTINELRPIYLHLYANPIFMLILVMPTQQTHTPLPQSDPVANHPPPTPPPASKAPAQGKGQPSKTTHSYSSVAATPASPCLVLDYSAITTPEQWQTVITN